MDYLQQNDSTNYLRAGAENASSLSRQVYGLPEFNASFSTPNSYNGLDAQASLNFGLGQNPYAAFSQYSNPYESQQFSPFGAQGTLNDAPLYTAPLTNEGQSMAYNGMQLGENLTNGATNFGLNGMNDFNTLGSGATQLGENLTNDSSNFAINGMNDFNQVAGTGTNLADNLSNDVTNVANTTLGDAESVGSNMLASPVVMGIGAIGDIKDEWNNVFG